MCPSQQMRVCWGRNERRHPQGMEKVHRQCSSTLHRSCGSSIPVVINGHDDQGSGRGNRTAGPEIFSCGRTGQSTGRNSLQHHQRGPRHRLHGRRQKAVDTLMENGATGRGQGALVGAVGAPTGFVIGGLALVLRM